MQFFLQLFEKRLEGEKNLQREFPIPELIVARVPPSSAHPLPPLHGSPSPRAPSDGTSALSHEPWGLFHLTCQHICCSGSVLPSSLSFTGSSYRPPRWFTFSLWKRLRPSSVSFAGSLSLLSFFSSDTLFLANSVIRLHSPDGCLHAGLSLNR